MSFRVPLFTWCVYLSLITCGLCDTASEAATKNCIICTTEFNGTFDLSRLRSESALKYIGLGFTLEFNVCGGTVPGSCGGQAGVSACYRNKTSGKDTIVGQEVAGVTLDNHVPTFEFVGEECAKDKKYTLTLQAICDYGKVKDPITLVQREGCHYLLQYKSSKACLKASKPAQCQFPLENKKTINFASVSTENQYVETKDLLFVINVCNPVVYGPRSVCPPDTNVCVLNQATGKAMKVGSDLRVVSKGKSSVLMYSSNTKCEADPKMNMSAKIDLKCDLQQDERISFKETVVCSHIFEWYSPLACETTEQCVVTHSSTGFKYDLRPLSHTPFNVTTNNSTFFFGICASFHPCNESMGICNDSKGLGYLNQDLKINETGFPYLEYIDGTCNDGKNSSTKIQFSCAKDAAEDNKITVLEDTGCRVIIQFATKLACPADQISCKQDLNGKVYDLIPLIDNVKNYEANIADGVLPKDQRDVKFFLNVCRDLVAQPGLSCHGGSSVCRAKIINGKPENETSLGYPETSLTVINKKEPRPQLKYQRGDPCPNSAGDMYGSTIEFSCNEKVGRGRPLLTSVSDDCQYMFHWETNVLCSNGPVDYNSTACSLTNPHVKGSFNLTEVESGGKLIISNNETINLCDLRNYTAEMDYFSQLINLKFSGGGSLRLQCGNNQTNNLPYKDDTTTTFVSTSVCRLFTSEGIQLPEATSSTVSSSSISTEAPKVINSSSAVAPSATTIGPSKENATTERASAAAAVPPPARSGMSAWGITGVLFLICAVALVGIVLRSPHRRAQVMSLFRRKNVAVSYTRVSNEEASTLLMTPAGLSESDDELLV